ncbi:SAF domain-containing protein [Bacillus cihuensis]|uniref:SAF domain-containing protein n=1 Tax=Bacillus cihuensis TaxID=1208599 RepID=UPI0003F86236|nr:SAF domain-containing protein [Bacillus cihuensis]
MNIRLRTKKLIIAGLWGALGMLIIASVVGAIWYQSSQKKELALRAQYDKKIQEYEEWADANVEAYSVKDDIRAGTKITQDMIQEVVVPNRAASKDLIASKILLASGLYAKVDLKANSVLTNATTYREEMLEKDVREIEYNFVVLPTKLKKEAFVDLRIQFPNGDDYILLSKKQVKDLTDSTVWMNLNEGEILMMSSAIVDAYMEEAKIYAVEYVDGYVQENSNVTYPVKANVRELITESPNIVSIAELNLEKQNRKRLEDQLHKMDATTKQELRQNEKADRSETNTDGQEQTKVTTEEDIFTQAEGGKEK